MIIEYWLQKKTIGGWSYVTKYEDLEQATKNYNNVSKGDSGYSWRLCKVETIEEKLLVDHEEVEEVLTPEEITEAVLPKNGWGDVPKSNGWGVPVKSDSEAQHGMVGKVWLINHSLRVRARVSEDKVDGMTKEGYERGGPKTPFRT